ncbi:hypothetical protein FOZ60_012143 [Perkinsus olseni]|uniref:Protease Do-like PDZ domain-containing protein n=1 Tax=Perkinsus olseni TaxID=32597 RepID=A0A7J6ND46_PEROL|nr:hypothetical protein FOZ60_012143 [Perkinsus olseni]
MSLLASPLPLLPHAITTRPFLASTRLLSTTARRLFSTQRPSPADLAVVKLHVTRQRPSWTVPWQTTPVEASSGSGCLLSLPESAGPSWRARNFVLTAAHVVADSIYLTVQRNTDYFEPNKFPAVVRAVCHDSDLALVEVTNDKEGFRNGGNHPSPDRPAAEMKPLELARWDDLPELRDTVQVVGYPVGGDKLSVTSGVVSRCEVVEYSHSARPALGITVDAAINAGNSGGPIMCGNSDKILGVAFQKYVSHGVENQGHAVPSYLIWRFINRVIAGAPDAESLASTIGGVGDGSLDLPCLGVTCQPVENDQFKKWLGVEGGDTDVGKDRKGVMVSWSVNPALKKYDVITAINGTPLDSFGHVWYLGRRLYMTALLDSFYVGDAVELTVLSRGDAGPVVEGRTVGLMSPKDCFLVPKGQMYDVKAPPYLIAGGLVFQPLSIDYLRGWTSDRDRPTHLQHTVNTGRKCETRQECVVLTQVLADECNSGYGSGWVGGPIVEKVNNENICCLAHLEKILDDVVYSSEESAGYVVLELLCYDGPFTMVLASREIRQGDDRVKERYGLPRLRSDGSSRRSGCPVHTPV